LSARDIISETLSPARKAVTPALTVRWPTPGKCVLPLSCAIFPPFPARPPS